MVDGLGDFAHRGGNGWILGCLLNLDDMAIGSLGREVVGDCYVLRFGSLLGLW